MKSKSRITYSVRIDPELVRLLKHVAIDEKRSVGDLVEEGIGAVLKKRKILNHSTSVQKHSDGLDLDDDQFDVPDFLREHTD